MNDRQNHPSEPTESAVYRRHREYWGDRLQFPRMSVLNRAKQFAPYAAVAGVDDAMARKERRRIPRPELSEDALAALDQAMAQLVVGSCVTVEYYRPVAAYRERALLDSQPASDSGPPLGERVRLTGRLTRVDAQRRFLMVDETRIPLSDVLSLSAADA